MQISDIGVRIIRLKLQAARLVQPSQEFAESLRTKPSTGDQLPGRNNRVLPHMSLSHGTQESRSKKTALATIQPGVKPRTEKHAITAVILLSPQNCYKNKRHSPDGWRANMPFAQSCTEALPKLTMAQ